MNYTDIKVPSYTEAVDLVDTYFRTSAPIFSAANGQSQQFQLALARIVEAIDILKSHEDYDGENPQLSLFQASIPRL